MIREPEQDRANSGDVGEDEIDLTRLAGLLLDHRWLIAGITATIFLLGALYAFTATPVYQADALLHVESRKAGAPAVGDLSELFDSDASADTEIQILRSRMVLGRTIDELKMDISVRPADIPFWRRAPRNNLVFAGWEDDSRRIRVERLETSEFWTGEPLLLEVQENNRFRVIYEGRTLLEGAPGEDLLTEAGDISLRVSDLNASNGSRFELRKLPRRAAISAIHENLSVSEQGRNTGILHASLTGENRVWVREVLQSLTRNYVTQNIQRTAEEAERSLEFLEEQLPEIRDELNQAEDQLNEYRLEAESVDLTQETRSMLERLVELEARLNELRMRESEISRRYTREHPAYRTLIDQRRELEEEKERLEERARKLPEKQQQIFRLRRDVDLNQEIYLQLVNRAQELRVMRAGTVGNVRIIDEAMLRDRPVAPRKALILALSLVLGGMIALGWVLIRAAFNRTIQSPEELERQGIPVYASLPKSDEQQRSERILKLRNGRNRRHPLLAVEDPADLAVEAVRSLRTSLHFAMLEARNRVLMISGPSPEVGKSFTAANLGVVLAQAGQRVLVLDADLRKGHLHQYFDMRSERGLSEYLSGQEDCSGIIQDTRVENLHFISRGVVPPNPSELLMHPRLAALFGELEKRFDMVIADTPPILAVTDAAIVGRLAGASLLVARYGRNTVREVEQTMKRFQLNGVEIKGCIVNCIERRASNRYSYYAYEYGREGGEKN